jgi:hypothetical protein
MSNLCKFIHGRCEVCGYETDLPSLIRNCKPPRPISAKKILKQNPMPKSKIRLVLPKIMLGDLIEKVLTFFGITKERIYRLTRKECNCPARQQWLNEWWLNKTIRLEIWINSMLKR